MELIKTPLGQIIKIIIILLLISMALWFLLSQTQLVDFFKEALEAMRDG